MKRVTKRVRKVRSAGAREHLVYTSTTHARDKAAADRLRQARYVRVAAAPRLAPEPFPRAAELAWQCGIREAKVRLLSQEEYTEHLAHARRDASVWYTPSKKRKKNGEVQMQKRKGEGLADCYFSFPPWVSEYLAQLTEMGELERVMQVSLMAVSRAAQELQRRTQYTVVGFALHPDSKGVLGYHVQYQTAAGGKLLGRSADGRKGRKGLRLVGDAMSAVARLGEYVSVTDRFGLLAPGKEYDDLAINHVLDTQLKKLLAPEWPQIEAAARRYAKDWKKRQDEALSGPEEVSRLKAELSGLTDRLTKFVDSCVEVLPTELVFAVRERYDKNLRRGPTEAERSKPTSVPDLSL